MITRRFLLQSAAAAAAYPARGSGLARAEDAPGVTATEIKFGQTIALSGPASAYSVVGRAEAAYFRMINEQGGVNGRKLNFLDVDDAYSPPKTLEQTGVWSNRNASHSLSIASALPRSSQCVPI